MKTIVFIALTPITFKRRLSHYQSRVNRAISRTLSIIGNFSHMSHPFYAICNLFMKFSKTHISFKDTDIARFRHRNCLDITYFTETEN